MSTAPAPLFRLALFTALCGAACTGGSSTGDAGGDAAGPPGTGVAAVGLADTISGAGLTAPVDVVRDQWGVPHIYGNTMGDVFYAQGYVEAMDRLVQMDILRRNADGTLAEIVGALSTQVVDLDIQNRLHHLRSTAAASWALIQASQDPADQRFVKAVGRFADGVNAYVADLKSGKYSVPGALFLLWQPDGWKPWTEVDSVMLITYETFYFNFTTAEIALTQLRAKTASLYDHGADAAHLARKGLGTDLWLFSPFDATHTIDGWTGMNGDTTHASLLPADRDGNLLALLGADEEALRAVGHDFRERPHASNNWVVSGKLSATGHAMLANDTHVPLQNPSIWYLVHLVDRGGDVPFNVYGEAVAGVPSIVIGMNEHVAWGATTNQMDLTDIYQEQVVTCDGSTSPCVMFGGKKVALTPRVETFHTGKYGVIDASKDVSVTFYDVPQHGPVIPRLLAGHKLDALGSSELSIKYVGYQPEMLFRVLERVLTNKTMVDMQNSLDSDNHTAGFNWVVADDGGNIGWTQVAKVPRRPAGNAPYLILPGDGSAEWTGDLDPKYIPHAWNPDKGYLATANADPIGVSDSNDPFFSQPMVDGAPLYLAWEFVDGARAGRITKRIQAMVQAGQKISLDDMQSIQADSISEHAQELGPVLAEAMTWLGDELGKPGTHAEISDIAKAAPAAATAALPALTTVVKGWTFATPSGAAEDMPSAADIADSQATLLFHVWVDFFIGRVFGDEMKELAFNPGGASLLKTLWRACNKPDTLAEGKSSAGEPIVFDDITTPAKTETKHQLAVLAYLDAVAWLQKTVNADASKWRWGAVHTLTLDFPFAMDALKIPLKTDPNYPTGYPRKGAPETVDPGGEHYSQDAGGNPNYTYAHGPGIRFVVDLDPVKGPTARNVIPGGETFDPASPHYSDLMQLWRKNKSFDIPFHEADVVTSANAEVAAHAQNGRLRFQ